MAREATLAAPVARPLLSRRARELLTGYAYLLPVALALGGTVLIPIVKAMQMSLYNHVLIKPHEYGFIGLGNYARLLRDDVFWLSLWNSFLWVFGSVSLQFVGGFAAALLLHQGFRGRALFRTLTLLPWIIPGVVVALIWEFLYQPNYGALNDVLARLGLMTEKVAWLSNPSLAMPAVIATNVWRGVPFFAIMLLAGLQAIPDELYEAARVDGANPWQQFRFITLPSMKPTIFYVVTMGLIGCFQVFDQIYVMTEGGPLKATLTTAYLLYREAFVSFNMGYACAIAFVLASIIFVVTMAQKKVMGE